MSTEIKPKRQFMIANEAMFDALDKAEGMSPHELRCFKFNLDQFLDDMLQRAEADDLRKKFPMGRHDWGKGEKP